MKYFPLLILFIVAACSSAPAPKTAEEQWAENVAKMFGTTEVVFSPVMQFEFAGGQKLQFSKDTSVFQFATNLNFVSKWHYLERVISPTSAVYSNINAEYYTNITFTIKNGVMEARLLSSLEGVGTGNPTNATHTVIKK